MFQNSNIIHTNVVPDGMSPSDLISAMQLSQSAGIFPMDMASGGSISTITELKADTIFEHLGDILALERIKPHQYFQLKSMLNSSDRESAEVARKIIIKNLQEV